MSSLRAFLAVALLAVTSVARATPPTPEELLAATDDTFRGETSHATIEMHVVTARYDRTMRMEAWSQGADNSLIRILAPVKDAGVSTLKVGDNIWNYLPKIDRTMKIPSGMMGGSWMGSHFTNDDLVQNSRFSDDFTSTVTGSGEGDDAIWTLDLVPKPDAPVVWGHVIIRVRGDRIPLDAQYFDEDGSLARTMTWGDVQEMDGHHIPTTMTLVPGDAPDELTRITYVDLDFDVDLPASTFTLQALRR